jgi:1-acyl-sn-glycerol-3-phosphate acyltransferase
MLAFIPILFIGLFKLIPYTPWQSFCARLVDRVVMFWSGVNNFFINRTQKTKWRIDGLDSLNKKDWYLIVANHQSWMDIVVLQKVFNRKIPVLKFFIKDQLKWVPLMGFAWWAMGCPFMKRYSKEQLLKHPHKKGKDIKRTQKAMRLFRYRPTSIINFVEGTRFTEIKKGIQQSPYHNLLKPKAGGISYAISAMGEKINSLIDVTIHYSSRRCSLWDFLCRRIDAIHVTIRKIQIPKEFLTDRLVNDANLQQSFREWLNKQWHDKDQLLLSMNP